MTYQRQLLAKMIEQPLWILLKKSRCNVNSDFKQILRLNLKDYGPKMFFQNTVLIFCFLTSFLTYTNSKHHGYSYSRNRWNISSCRSSSEFMCFVYPDCFTYHTLYALVNVNKPVDWLGWNGLHTILILISLLSTIVV